MTTEIKQIYPEELSEQQLCAALTHSLGVPVKLQKLKIQQQQACGNYSSDIYRVRAEYRREDDAAEEEPHLAQILVKDLFVNLSTISNEYFMYANVLPVMNKTLATCNIAPVAPYVFHAHKTTKETHYFEDLSVRDYKVHSRIVGYGKEQALLLFKRLGQFHAASLMFKEKHPALVGGLREYYACSAPALMDFVVDNMRGNIEQFAQIAATWAGYEKILQQMRDNLAIFRSKFAALFKLEEAPIQLVTHGDLWINNILLHSDTQGTADDAVFLDYQTSFLGSPAFDIHNLLMTSVQLDVIEHNYNALIEQYYLAFSGTLRASCCEATRIPSLEAIRAELHRTDYYNFYLLTFPFAQTILSEELTKGMDFAAFSDAVRMQKNRQNIYSNERVLQTYKYMLKQFESRGLLN